MHTNYLRHLANMLLVGVGGVQLPIEWVNLLSTPKKCRNFEVADIHDAILEVIDEQAIYYSKFNLFVEIIPTISNF